MLPGSAGDDDMNTLNGFNDALWRAKINSVAGADELWSLFMVLADDVEGDELMGKLDAYQCDASPEAQALYSYLMK
jgi:hypothetical protein